MSTNPHRPRTVIVFSVELAVFDEQALARAAKARAREDGLSDEDWTFMRSGVPDDLIMLLDPGLMPDAGFEILQSTCEVIDVNEPSEPRQPSEVGAHAVNQR